MLIGKALDALGDQAQNLHLVERRGGPHAHVWT
jgi:hypothetical protein